MACPVPVVSVMSRWLVSYELWAIVEPLIPLFAPCAQGIRTPPVDARVHRDRVRAD